MASIEIDIDDLIFGLARYEKQELADALYEDGYVPKQMGGVHPDDVYVSEFDAQVSKLIGNAWKLTKEDEETILKIANKLV